MDDIIIVIAGTLIGTLVGVVVGYALSTAGDWYKQKKLITRYRVVLQFELKQLKEDIPDGLDQVIHNYDQLVAAREGRNTDVLPAGQNPSDFLKRWNFQHKYMFLRNNFEKISLFDENTIKSILKIYSLLEEFEEYKQMSISDPEALARIGMGDPEYLLIKNLKTAQKEIPKALALLNSNESNAITGNARRVEGITIAERGTNEILIEIRDILLNKNNDDENSHITVLLISIFSAFVAWVALSIVYLQSLSAIEFTINQTSNQTTWYQMFVTSPLQMQQNNLVQMMNLQYAIYVIGAVFWILAAVLIYKAIQAVKKRFNY